MSWLVYLFFFGSGFTGLIYEVLWTRLFVLVMGGTVYSFTTVLVAFMSGLALGGYLGGRYADRIKINPLLIYGGLEGLIGFYCLLIPSLIKSLNPLFDGLYPILASHNFLGLLVRFFFSGLILLLPCTMMGATLPVLVRLEYKTEGELGKTTGLLYGINTLGAVFGSMFSGLVLLPAYGQTRTLYFGAGINFSICCLAVLLSWLQAGGVRVKELEGASVKIESRFNFKLFLLLGCYGLSGLVAMVYQIVWTRALILSLGTTLYVLSLILTGYIGGLALGALLITPVADRVKRVWLWIGLFEAGIGLSSWLVVPVLARLPVWMVYIYRPRSYVLWLGIEFLIGFGLILVPTFLMGGLLPLVVRLYGEIRGGVGRAVGAVYAWNTIGAILGSFFCGFFLLRWLGLRNSLVLGCGISLLIGMIFIWLERIRLGFRVSSTLALMLLGILFIFIQPGWSPEVINSGPYIYFQDYFKMGASGGKIIDAIKSANKTLFHKEGVEATVSVFESLDHILALRINGKTDASTGVDMGTQILTGHLPLLLHPRPRKVAVIGLASGVTLGSALTHPIEKAICLEISPEVVEASHYFNSINRRPLSDPRSRLVIDDGRYYLAHTPEKYDVIISEPSNPWIGGMGLLFTKEFFSLARAKLEPQGIMLIWIGIYDLNLESVQMIVRTFIQVFPEASLWESLPGGDYLLIGFKDKMELDYSQIKSRLRSSRVRADLARIHLERPEKIGARFLMGPDGLKKFADTGPLHLDDLRQLELKVPRIKYTGKSEENVSRILQKILAHREEPVSAFRFSPAIEREELENLNRFYQARVWIMEAQLAMADEQTSREALEKFFQAYQVDPDDSWVKDNLYLAYYFQGEHFLRKDQFSEAVSSLSKAWEYKPRGSELPVLVGFYHLWRNEFPLAEQWANQALEKNQKDSLAWLLRAQIELKQGRPDLALTSLARAQQFWTVLEIRKNNSELIKALWRYSPVDLKAELFYLSGEANYQLGNFSRALSDFEKARALAPEYVSALVGSGKTSLALNQLQPALETLSQAIKLKPSETFAHFYLAQTFARIPEERARAIEEFKIFLELEKENSPARVQAEKQLAELIKGAQ